MSDRPDFPTYFAGIAEAVAARGDCVRRQVGAVLVRPDKSVASCGYNGSWPSGPSCLAGECPRALSGVDSGSSYDTGPGVCHASHAELNAIVFARENTTGYDMYVTTAPCDGCVKVMRAARLRSCTWPTGYLTVLEDT